MTDSQHIYERRPRKDKHGFDLISDALPFGRLWYLKVADAIAHAKHRSRSHDAVIYIYDEAGKIALIDAARYRSRLPLSSYFLHALRRAALCDSMLL